MSTGSLRQGKIVMRKAVEIFNSLKPYVKQAKVVGSLRREETYVRDIEILVVSQTVDDLLGEPIDFKTNEWEKHMVDSMQLKPAGLSGDRQKKFMVDVGGGMVYLDLFVTTPCRWGIQTVIRTGCSDFSRTLVTPVMKGGLLPDHLRVKDGYVWECERNGYGTVIKQGDVPNSPSEEEFIELTCGDWIDPRHRNKETIKRLLAK